MDIATKKIICKSNKFIYYIFLEIYLLDIATNESKCDQKLNTHQKPFKA